MRGVVNSIVERRGKNGKPYWRVEIIDRRGRSNWFTSFQAPTYVPGEEIDFIAFDKKLVALRGAYDHIACLTRAVLLLVAQGMGARTPEDAVALAMQMEGYVFQKRTEGERADTGEL